MLSITNSDIFDVYLNYNDSLTSKMQSILSGKSNSLILNQALQAPLQSVKRVYKEVPVLRMVDAIESGKILLLKIPPEYALSKAVPFFKYEEKGVQKICVNLSDYVRESKGSTPEQATYDIDLNRLYVLGVSAYLYLHTFTDRYVMSPKAMLNASVIWGRLFTKVLAKIIALSTNKERYEAYTFFAMKFFLLYYLQVPELVAENIGVSYLTGKKKNHLILDMEEKMMRKGYTPYKDFTSFCISLFDAEISNVRGVRGGGMNDSLNLTFYMKNFVNMYTIASTSALCSFPYFFFLILSTHSKTNIVNDRAWEDVINLGKSDVPKLIAELYKDA